MQAVVLQALGGPEQLVLSQCPDPTPGTGEVLVRVRAAGLNFADVMTRQGRYLRQPRLPAIPGFEIAGEVLAIGPEVTGLRPGQRVMGTARSGAYAELAVAPAAMLRLIPDHLSFEAAAAVPVVFLTAYHALITYGRLSAGERVLIHAAGGGVGTVAVQWARALGATVYATASSQAKLDRVRSLGADVGINYAETDFAAAVREHTGGEGIDLVLESVGGQVFTDSLNLLRPLGRLVVVGRAGGAASPVDPALLLARNLTISGLFLGALRQNTPQAAGAWGATLEVLLSRQVRPVIGHVLPLAQIQEAHRLLESRESFGKIIVTP